MVRTLYAAAVLLGTSTMALAQTPSAPLVVSATVVSSCKVSVPRQVDRSGLSTMPVDIACARRDGRRADVARVQRPPALHRSVDHALVVINF
jgi:hypothetical protein